MAEEDLADPSQAVLDRLPGRVLTFLRGIATTLPIRATMTEGGYTDADQSEGWVLLERASGRKPETAPISDTVVMKAIAEIDRWDEKGIRRIKAIIKRHHPELYEFLCSDLVPGRGIASVWVVTKILKRIQALKDAPEREATREADHAALATLATRKFDDALWTKLDGLVLVVQRPEFPAAGESAEAEAPVADETTEAPDTLHEALLELHGWYQEWAETARAEITRRDYLIRLGLAQRRTKTPKPPNDEPPA